MTQYKLYQDHFHYDTVEADSVDEALNIARNNVSRADYDECKGTLVIPIYVQNVEDAEDSVADDVYLPPEEPKCSELEHDWQSPIALVGGIESNPGVWGKGGGVIIKEVCVNCGCLKKVDTWSQNSQDGTIYTSTTFQPNAFSDEEIFDAIN